MSAGRGMKTVVFSCPFVPAEWIAAHGLSPRRIVPSIPRGAAPSGSLQGLCPFAEAFARYAGGDVVVATTVCDHMRRIVELPPLSDGPPLFLMNVPTTWETVAAQKLYVSEVRRLGRFLEEQGGRAPTEAELTRVMIDFDDCRTALRAARPFLPARGFSEAIACFNGGDRGSVAKLPQSGEMSHPGGVPVALVGGPLLGHHFELFDAIGEAGGSVVLDATGTGERTLPPPFDRRRIGSDPFSLLTESYFGTIPDAFRRPNSALYVWLRDLLAERGVRGILFIRHTWCDTWHAETQRLKEWCDPIPLLPIDTGGDSRIDGRTLSRVLSFLEVLQ